jgi:hypothetical protein
MPHGEQPPAAAAAETDAPPAHEAEAVLADIAMLALIIADQIALASSETERWALGFLDGIGEIEQHIRRLRRSCPCRPPHELPGPPQDAGLGAFATLSGIDTVEAVVQRTQMIAQYQDIVRQQLETMSGALAALHGQCRRLSVNPGWRGTADAHGIADIIQRVRRSYIVPRQDEVHQQTLIRLQCVAGGPPAVPHAAPGGNN